MKSTIFLSMLFFFSTSSFAQIIVSDWDSYLIHLNGIDIVYDPSDQVESAQMTFENHPEFNFSIGVQLRSRNELPPQNSGEFFGSHLLMAGNLNFQSNDIALLALSQNDTIGPMTITTTTPVETFLYWDGIYDGSGDPWSNSSYVDGVDQWSTGYFGFALTIDSEQYFGFTWLEVLGSVSGGYNLTFGPITLNTQAGAEIIVGQGPTELPGDINDDGIVDIADFIEMNSSWGACAACNADINGDGVVNVDDFLILNSTYSD